MPIIADAGFSDVGIYIVASQWEISDPGAPFYLFGDGIVRGGAMLQSQPAQNTAAIGQAATGSVMGEHCEPGRVVPIPAFILSDTSVDHKSRSQFLPSTRCATDKLQKRLVKN